MEEPQKTVFEQKTRLSNEESNAITRECLFEALLILMKKKPFEKITVSELVKRAGVSRTTFYRNYNSIEQIITDPLLVIVETLRTSLTKEKYQKNIKSWYRDMLFYLKENYAFMLEMLLKATDGKFLDMRVLGEMFDPPANTPEEKLKLIAFNGAIKELLTSWVRWHCEGDIDLLSEVCVSLQELCLGNSAKR